MTPSQLKSKIEETGSPFFTRNNMKFAGDTMANYGVYSEEIYTNSNERIHVWTLYRKKPVKGGLKSSAYFRQDNFKKTFIKEGK